MLQLRCVLSISEPSETSPEADHRVGHAAHVGLGDAGGELLQVAGADAHVGVAHHQHLVTRVALEGDELVHLGIQPRRGLLDAEAEALRPAADRGLGHRMGGVRGVPHAQHHLPGAGVLQRGEGGEVGLQVVIQARQRLEDAHPRPRGGRHRLPAAMDLQEHQDDEVDDHTRCSGDEQRERSDGGDGHAILGTAR